MARLVKHFLVAAFILTVSTSATGTMYGNRQNGDDLVCHHHVHMQGRKCFIIVTEKECHLSDRYEKITQIVVQEFSTIRTRRKGKAKIVAGGVGVSFVKFRLYSFINLPLKFDIYVYARKYREMPILDTFDDEASKIHDYNCRVWVNITMTVCWIVLVVIFRIYLKTEYVFSSFPIPNHANIYNKNCNNTNERIDWLKIPFPKH